MIRAMQRGTALALLLAAAIVACGEDVRLGGVAENATVDGSASVDAATNDAGMIADASGSSVADAKADACSAHPSTDAQNCGACGHDCLGGACVGSVCQPHAIATGLGGPWWLALDATTVYWTEHGVASPGLNAVRRVQKTGAGLVTLATADGAYGGITVDTSRVYWSLQTTPAPALFLETTPLSPAPPAVTDLSYVMGTFAAGGVAVDATNIYFTNGASVFGASKSSISMASPVIDPVNGAGALLLDGANLLVASPAGGVFTGPAALMPTVMPTALPGAIGAADITLGGARIFGASGTTVWSLPRAGGALVGFSTSEIGAGSVAVDSTTLYWTAQTELRSAPLGGGAPIKTLASGFTQLGHVVTDATAIYFADFNGNTIWKLAK